jgi:hypothetical protein
MKSPFRRRCPGLLDVRPREQRTRRIHLRVYLVFIFHYCMLYLQAASLFDGDSCFGYGKGAENAFRRLELGIL